MMRVVLAHRRVHPGEVSSYNRHTTLLFYVYSSLHSRAPSTDCEVMQSCLSGEAKVRTGSIDLICQFEVEWALLLCQGLEGS